MGASGRAHPVKCVGNCQFANRGAEVVRRHEGKVPSFLMHPELGLEEEAIEGYFEGVIRKNYLTHFLNRHPELVSKLSSNFDKWRIKQSNPEVIQHHFARVQQVQKKYFIT